MSVFNLGLIAKEDLSNGKRKGKCKAIPVTGSGVPQGCETSRLPHFLDNQLTEGGEVKEDLSAFICCET
jgi:hypothetical protein